MDSLDDLLRTARAAAAAAADVHRRMSASRDPEDSTEKGHADWVSEVDRAAEEAAVGVIREGFGDHAIAAEEHDWGGPTPAEAEVTWYVDPLDGTTNYLHGYPHHAASVAARDRVGLAVGVVVHSGRWERFEAKRGGGAALDGDPISISRVSGLKMALIGTGFPFKQPERLDEYLRQFKAIMPRVSGVRRTGSAAVDLCDLACGRLDGFWELRLAPWDVAAGILIVEESGGRVTDLDGGTDILRHGSFLAGNPEIHSRLLELLSEIR